MHTNLQGWRVARRVWEVFYYWRLNLLGELLRTKEHCSSLSLWRSLRCHQTKSGMRPTLIADPYFPVNIFFALDPSVHR